MRVGEQKGKMIWEWGGGEPEIDILGNWEGQLYVTI